MKKLVQPSPEIWHRDDFPLLCNWRCLWRAVEIGVDRAEFSQMFLSRWLGHEYYGIDPYLPTDGFEHPRQADLAVASIRYERFARVARLINADSLEVAQRFHTLQDRGSHHTDFAYIDGNHVYAAVMTDIQTWWPKISDIGILAGHDFDDTHPDVVRAVTEFAARENVIIYITDEPTCRSWYCYKSGMPGPGWVRNSRR